MTRPTIKVRTVADGPSEQAEKEVWAGVRSILGNATLSRLHPEHYPPGFQEEIHSALTALRDGHDVLLSKRFTQAAFDTFTNLRNIVASGQRHLRECRRCHGWFLADHQKRVTCDSVTCQRKDVAVRKAKRDKKVKAIDKYWKLAVRRVRAL